MSSSQYTSVVSPNSTSSAGVSYEKEEFILIVDRLFNRDLTFARELPCYGTDSARLPPYLLKKHGATRPLHDFVVGDNFDDETNAMRCINLIQNLEEFTAFEFACTALDGAIDIVLWAC